MPIPSDEGIPSLGDLKFVILKGDTIRPYSAVPDGHSHKLIGGFAKGSEFPKAGEEHKATAAARTHTGNGST